jgi:hypothetical protein
MKYYYYNPYTGYSYRLSEHAKLRIWERFRTLDIEHEFKLFHYLMVKPQVDDLVANLNIGEELIIKNCYNNKVYVVVLTTDLVIECKTVYRDNYYRQFVPNNGQPLYRLYKDETIHKWVEQYN